MPRIRFVWLAAALVAVLAIVALKFSPAAPQLVWNLSAGGTRLLPLVTVSALLDSLNPCAFSVLVVTVAFLLSLGASRRRLLTIGGVYVLGIFTVYLLIGLGIVSALHLFNTPHFMGRLGAVLLIGLGSASLLGALFPAFPLRLKMPAATQRPMARLLERATVPAAFGLGLLVGLCEFPCTGGPYLAVLGLLHDQTTRWRGFWYLLWYNLLFIAPLVVILALASGRRSVELLEAWKRRNLRATRLITGIGMIILGFAILTF
ncbi:MAG: hypothetical protein A3J59_03915 [Candidatus Buchananbacteria bacterium RIFCSPHIGHO2_02_FULL_56_16]|uniref:Cytochrome C biogenesis protein transmembrane domain-containing protein n=1 Tax=Candidatus Buchananbacteria bacterium RIFCSPHIGHO2_02_FULL_56_16 TaxID=1797542 RepID=A0A1G1YI76_9BACT|nr:MAG: hypothetical protein A3J59_03915 [Candidatus Buchananbacteria bacterium RIFCSPHIGHO2_02_FULL_56_16]